jgi:hypothetical protein
MSNTFPNFRYISKHFPEFLLYIYKSVVKCYHHYAYTMLDCEQVFQQIPTVRCGQIWKKRVPFLVLCETRLIKVQSVVWTPLYAPIF